jgi:hypothetical protein
MDAWIDDADTGYVLGSWMREGGYGREVGRRRGARGRLTFFAEGGSPKQKKGGFWSLFVTLIGTASIPSFVDLPRPLDPKQVTNE